ncbi:MAG: thiamine phosphate synthase [Candidatus Contendobacter odensis]|uniref:Thiamine-phosphate synthase n=1 Tax=Candidatus Contendibacter odensensis TaxID=1400860 RepID=A0A2G6PF47_9GAMM|nr:MAG: thiamine phosphate synthase [Candidatus Contendobacter odensis]
MNKRLSRGLYAITDPLLIPDKQLNHAVEQAILGGARLIQYRAKNQAFEQCLAQAQSLNKLCHYYHIPLIINDDIELASQTSAAGVHLGKDDPIVATARARLGQQAIIGVSCYNQIDLAMDAARQGADYIAFGAFFSSPTKPTGIRASIQLVREARVALNIPIVAIGGITPDNAPPLITAGADMLAVISGVFAQTNIQTTAHRYTALFAS